jgi:dimeric dUTPase (all-alpha-NTP-PPase superfamily)
MSYRMIYALQRLMCDKFSILRTLKELNERDEKLTNDKLTEMYEMQSGLDNRVIKERGIQKSLDEWVRDITVAMESEIDEIRREINWKWWKNAKEIDKSALQGEVIDMWHFLLMLSRHVGLSPEDIYRLYMEKNAENHARQSGTSDKEGYSING